MFPAFYPFKLTRYSRIKDKTEIVLSCPNKFYYNDNDIDLLNEDVEGGTQLDDYMAEICDKENLTNPFRKKCPFKTKRTDLAYEIEYLDLFTMNYEKYLMKLIPAEKLYSNNYIIQKARSTKKDNLLKNDILVDLDDLLEIIHKLRNKSTYQFNSLFMSMECFDERKVTNKQHDLLQYRIILASRAGKSYISETTLTEYKLQSNYTPYSNFFFSLQEVSEVYVNFAAVDSEKGHHINIATNFFCLTKCIRSPRIFYLNLSCNQFATNFLKEFMNKNPGFGHIRQLHIRMDCCYLNDADLTNLVPITLITNLEKLDLSLERNKLTPSCLGSLLHLSKIPSLKELTINLGGRTLTNTRQFF